ncbi:YqgE/AlgH family protein [Deinococcus taeanensis]|uniref:YqgE/AlgH family protein n=1 Tax=Deinococcus taeanensis TaxID=2737050 RepID=UPI001CDD01A8|nr:YqgE/AlgH family protein [Deinococcus taeanensis]UBV42116.1 YqgE/AlgH family protein [Deinococcus taeanensis]
MSAPVTFLVASPHLRGGVFEGAVILLLEHDAKGAMGLIVNAPMVQTVEDLMADAAGQRDPAWLGGPVDPTLGWCLYPDPVGLDGEIKLLPGLNVSSSLDVLRAVMASRQRYMLVLGYAGWSGGQLAEEAREGAWVWVEQDTPALLWDVPAQERWQAALDRLGVQADRIMPGGAQA